MHEKQWLCAYLIVQPMGIQPVTAFLAESPDLSGHHMLPNFSIEAPSKKVSFCMNLSKSPNNLQSPCSKKIQIVINMF